VITLAVVTVLVSHALAALPLCRRIRGGRLPSTADFAILSVLIYYDLGLVVELLGLPYHNDYVPSLLEAQEATLVMALGILLVAPWLFLAGSYLAARSCLTEPQEPTLRLRPGRRALFYVGTVLLVLPLLAFSRSRLLQADTIWSARADIGSQFGPLIVIFYLPLHILAFYVRHGDRQSIAGRAFLIALVVAAIVATLPIGQRTNALLPLLILPLFAWRIRLGRLAVVAASLLILAVAILPLFKWQYASTDKAYDQVVADVIYSDISRAGILSAAIDSSPPVGTRILPYPLSDYVYCLFFFVPRSLAPFKGAAGAYTFTSYLAYSSTGPTEWVLGMGAIEEAILNAGWVMVPPILVLYGFGMGWLDRLSSRAPSLIVPIRLAALWSSAHHLPAILLLFGVMGGVTWSLGWCFSEPAPPAAPSPPRPLPRRSSLVPAAGRGSKGEPGDVQLGDANGCARWT
jgi:hypothetical protein